MLSRPPVVFVLAVVLVALVGRLPVPATNIPGVPVRLIDVGFPEAAWALGGVLLAMGSWLSRGIGAVLVGAPPSGSREVSAVALATGAIYALAPALALETIGAAPPGATFRISVVSTVVGAVALTALAARWSGRAGLALATGFLLGRLPGWIAELAVATGRAPSWGKGGPVMLLPLGVAGGSVTRVGLGDMLAAMAATAFVERGVGVVERERMDALLAEQDLQRTSRVNPDTAVKLGKLSGATWVVTGSVAEFQDRLVVSLRRVEVATGKVAAAVTFDAPLDLGPLQTGLAGAIAKLAP